VTVLVLFYRIFTSQVRKFLTEIASEYGVHPNQVTQWKKQVMEALPDLLGDKRRKKAADHEALVCELYQQIGQLKVELDWLKKKSGLGS
jgi:transposase